MGRGFELLCIVLLGLVQMAIMTGYDTQSFVQESVLHSKNEREPLTIDKYAGYYGQAVCSFFYMLTCLISPFVMSIVGPKWTVFAGSVCFSLFQMGFFFINNIYYYFSAGAMGVGFALFFTGCGGYMTSHSTRRTLEQNSAIQWAISCSCMLVGSVILSVVFTVHKDDQLVIGSANGTGGIKESPQHRNFSDDEILYMYGAFFALTVAANVIFVFLPSKEIEGCIEGRKEKRTALKQHIALVWSTFSNRQMLFLMPSFVHLGLWTLFWVCVYPTTLVFSHSLSRNIYLPALYSLFVGVGEVVIGCTITFMSHRIKNFGLKPTMWIGFVTTTILLACIVITSIDMEGRWDEGRGKEFATFFRLEYWRSTLDRWVPYRGDGGEEVLAGNRDTSSSVSRELEGAIVARRLRIVPVSNQTRTVCLRFKLYGCKYNDMVSSYSAPVASSADGLSLIDFSYDGKQKDGIYIGGLGKLTDGFEGHDNFEKFPQKWVGWRKQKNGAEFITLRFDFNDRRNISAILLHTSNQFKQHAPCYITFSSAELSFSQDGENFSGREIVFNMLRDRQFQTARIVRIPVNHRIASVVELKLLFGPSAEWLLLSEVRFESSAVSSIEEFSFHQIAEVTKIQDDKTNFLLLLLLLGSLLLCLCVLLFCLLRKRDRQRVKASSPPPTIQRGKEVRIAMVGKAITHTTPSTYQMAVDNEQNALLERRPTVSEASEYAEPDVTSSLLGGLTSSFFNTSAYASTELPKTAVRYSPLLEAVKYSDYGEVYSTLLPEIDRSQLQFVRNIGHGQFGEVHLCLLGARQVAVKRLIGSSADEEFAFQREIRVLGTLKHENIVEMVGVSSVEKPILCVMEYMQNGDLRSHLIRTKEIDTALCISICTQLAAGLSYLESCNFVHRDIAARNCLVDSEGNAKIADFGLARSLYSSDYYRMNRTKAMLPIRWMAPEAMLMGVYSSSSDAWAFAVTMWEVFSQGKQPFDHLSDDVIRQNIEIFHLEGHMQQVLPRPLLCPPSIYQLMTSCWLLQPTARPTLATCHLRLQAMIHQGE